VRRALLTLGVVAALVAGVPAVVAAPAPATGPGPQPPLPWLHVDHSGGALPLIKDAAGRTVLLRGANVNGLQDGYYSPRTHDDGWVKPFWPLDPAAYAPGDCPTNNHHTSDPPLCEVDANKPASRQSGAFDSRNDFAQMRALGFNVIRLTLSWSRLEPTPGRYDPTYLDRIAQVVSWAKQQRIYVLLDMHQDNYSRFIDDTAAVEVSPVLTSVKQSGGHADGAPPWAILTDGVPGLAPFGVDVFNLQMGAAFNSFWINRPVAVPQGEAPGTGLQDHYIGAVASLARRFKNESTVVGYELMNEPQSGAFAAPVLFDQAALFPFYQRVVDAITGTNDGGYRDLGIHDTRHLMFFEPWAIRNLVDQSLQLNVPFTTYPNLVYAPHQYTHVFTVDRTVGGQVPAPVPIPYPPSYDQALTTAAQEATQLGAALWIGEFGNGSNDDDTLLRGLSDAQDRHPTGSAVWAWKGNCDPGSNASQCAGTWATFTGDTREPPAQNLQLKPTRQKFLSRVYPSATAGTLLRAEYNPDTRTFAMSATATTAVTPGDIEHETVVFIPSTSTGDVRVFDRARLDRVVRTEDGNRIAYVAPTGGGVYAISVT
jgi:endoglycosylceramidase